MLWSGRMDTLSEGDSLFELDGLALIDGRSWSEDDVVWLVDSIE